MNKSDYIKGIRATYDAPNPQHVCKSCAFGIPYADGKSIYCTKYEAPRSKQGFCASWLKPTIP